MDIWSWVEDLQEQLYRDGNAALAELISEVPHYVCEGEHERVEALLAQGLAEANRLKLEWLQIFLRHWRLQSRVLHRLEVADNLDEAVALLEFAHRQDNVQCPQSVCAVQDLANCYANKDGSGFAEIRVEVAREGLAKITPAWDCYDCIGTELIDAHLDAGDFEEALRCAEQIKTERALENKEPFGEFSTMHCKALLACGQAQQALTTAERALEHGSMASVQARLELMQARCLHEIGQSQQALEVLPEFSTIIETPTVYSDWREFAVKLVADELWHNDEALDNRLHTLAHRLARLGCARDAFETYAAQMSLALDRTIVSTATLAADAMRSLLDDLHEPLTAPATLADLNTRLERLVDDSSGEHGGEIDIDALLHESDIDEQGLEQTWLRANAEPNNVDLQIALQHVLSVRGWSAAALAIAERQYRLHPEDDAALNRYGFAMLDNDRSGELCAEFERVSAEQEPSSTWYWLLAHTHYRELDISRCAEALDSLLTLEPGARNAREMRADMRTRLGDLGGALADLDKIVELDSEREHLHWDRVTLATRLERWPEARQIAAALGFKLSEVEDPNTPIEEDWEYCEILCVNEQGEERLLSAERTGPVTARLLEIPPMHHPRRLHDIVVFDPAPRNSAPEDDDEQARRRHRWHYRFLQLQSAGDWTTYELDGIRPAESTLDSLRNALRDLGCSFSIASSSEYCLSIPSEDHSDVETPALYARVAIPHSMPAQRVHELLGEQLHGLTPLVWTTLARDAGDDGCAARHEEIAREFQLDA